MVGLLAHRPHTVEELAEVLDIRASTVSHHAKKLMSAGLIVGEVQGHYHLYRLQLEALHEMSRRLLSPGALKTLAEDEGEDAYDRKVLATFLDDEGRLTALPMKRKKLDVVLRFALRRFEDEGPWTEKEVNARLESLSSDVASLRRGFIDHHYMTRDASGASYRRLGTKEQKSSG